MERQNKVETLLLLRNGIHLCFSFQHLQVSRQVLPRPVSLHLHA
jgi:hypothetical protein